MTTATSLPSPGRSAVLANAACVASMLVWAVGFPIADLLLAIMPPISVATIRLGLATAFLLPAWIIADGWREVRAANWARGLAVGAFGMGLGPYLLIYGQSRTDAVTTAVISATMPVVAIALECLLDGRRLTGRVVLGILLGVAGGVGVYGARMGNFDMGLGAAAVLVSTAVFAWASRASVSALPGLSALGRTAVTITGGALVILAVQALQPLLGGEAMPWDRLGPREWGLAAVYGVGSMAISQVLFLIGVAGLGIGVAAMHMNISPFYVMLLALAFGESWSWPAAAAAGLVVLGVILAQGRRGP